MKFHFEKNKQLFDDNLSTGIKLSSDIDEEILPDIIANKPVSDFTLPLIIGEGEVTASGPDERIKFKDINNLTINGNAEAQLRLAIIDNAEEVMEDLQTNDNLTVDFPEIDENHVYGIFSFEYDIEGDVDGEWPLGQVTLTANLDAATERRGAVVITLKKDTPIHQAFIDIIGELQSPNNVTTADDLPVGTYLVLEREASLSASFGAKAGLDFDWAYESQNEDFPGTVGLQAKLGASLSVGFDLAGEYSVVLSRPELDDASKKLHLNLYKRRQNGWNFATGISAKVQGELSQELQKLAVEDIIKVTIGIHHGQILEDLKKIRGLANPGQLEEKLHGLTDELLQEITGTDAFAAAKGVIVDLLDKWEAVGDEGGAKIIELIEENADIDLSEAQGLFKKLSEEDVAAFLEEKYEETGFGDTPFGQVLEAVVPLDDLFEVVAEAELVTKLQDKAGKIAELLDLEEQIKKLHATISDKLSLDRIREAVASENLDLLGDWLKGKITSFVGEEGKLADELEAINAFINKVEDSAEEFLEAVKKALQREYSFSLAYSFQKEKERTALIDATFDFAANPELGVILDDALDGKYNQLLTDTSIVGIHLHKGILTHRIKKQKTLSLTIPGVKRDFISINQSLAKGSFIDEEDGRLFMYELEASDEIRRSKRRIQLALNGDYLGKKKGNDFNVEKESLKLAYSFKLQNPKLKTKQLSEIVEPFILTNLSDVFSNSTAINEWVDHLDDQIESESGNGKRRFGRTLINMQLRASSSVGQAWFNAPGNKKHRIYKEVSAAMQAQLRELVRIYTFDDEDLLLESYNYDRLLASILYISLPPVKVVGYNSGTFMKKPTEVIKRLNGNIIRLVQRLESDPDEQIRNRADEFRNIQHASGMILDRYRTNRSFRGFVNNLINKESRKIKKTVKVATKMEGIRAAAASNPTQSLKLLSEFGSELTDVLNEIPVGYLARVETRFVGVNSFITVAMVLDSNVKADTTGGLELMVLQESSNFDMKSYLTGSVPDTKDLIVSQKILDLDGGN